RFDGQRVRKPETLLFSPETVRGESLTDGARPGVRNLFVFMRLHARNADRAHAFGLVHQRNAPLDQNARREVGEGRTLFHAVLEKLARPLGHGRRARLPMETSAVIAVAPSIRRKPSRKPASSTIEIDTGHLFLAASASQAASAFFTSAAVRHCL